MTVRAGVNSGAPDELKDLDPGAQGEYIWLMATTTTTRQTTETTCHCGANFQGSDHCPECQCEQFEATCDHDSSTREKMLRDRRKDLLRDLGRTT